MNQNPGVRIEVRIKSSEGVGGLLESLVAANAAAPLALPDLIALPRPLLESAALKGLLYPFDGLTDVMDNENWYDYARQLAFIQESTFGLPFAGDAMLLAYRLVALDVPPRDWEAAVGLGYPLAFAAADPLALFTLTQYQALGGQIQDGQGRPTLDETTLTQVLTFYQQASQAGVMPVWLTQLETDEQVWQAFAEEQAPMASIWASSYFNGFPSLGFETTIAPQVTSDANTYTLASGWGWALASPDPDRRQMAAQLAEFLVDVQFLAEWDSAAGYLPPHIDALESWGDEQLRPLVGMISMSAQLVPPDELLASLGPALEEATVLVLKQQADPQNAAKIAAEQVNQP
jgi:ABC-type glycerol-3-phosphate transport system substrate-binding protein